MRNVLLTCMALTILASPIRAEQSKVLTESDLRDCGSAKAGIVSRGDPTDADALLAGKPLTTLSKGVVNDTMSETRKKDYLARLKKLGCP